MKTIKQLLNLMDTDGDYGVEIEVEGEKLPRKVLGWRVTEDGSLKAEEALEYVMQKPASLEEVKSYLNNLDSAFIKNESYIDESIRAGTHVHMNFQNNTLLELFTFATAYYSIEDLLTKWCGDYREGNLFCLRARDAEFVLFALLDAIQNKNLKYLGNDNIRYASLNFCSLFKYGSLESRSMRSTRDLDSIYEWVTILDDLRNGAKSFKTPDEVILGMSDSGPYEFIKKLLPKTYYKFINYKNYHSLISEGIQRVQMIAFSTDWNSLEKKSNNPFILNEERWA